MQRRLVEVGLEGQSNEAAKLDEAGFAAAQKACRQKHAAGCSRLSEAYAKGLGTRPNQLLADQFRARACRLDAKRCAD